MLGLLILVALMALPVVMQTSRGVDRRGWTCIMLNEVYEFLIPVAVVFGLKSRKGPMNLWCTILCWCTGIVFACERELSNQLFFAKVGLCLAPAHGFDAWEIAEQHADKPLAAQARIWAGESAVHGCQCGYETPVRRLRHQCHGW